MPALRVLTLNIWFDQKLQAARTRGLLHLIAQLRPDVVCLQEVTPHVAQAIVQALGPGGWALSDSGDGASVEPYGVLIAVQPAYARAARFQWTPFPTNMCRSLLVCRLPGLAIGTVHLESLNFHPVREQQLAICREALAGDADALLVGDFNFCSERNFSGKGPLENDSLQRILPDYVDAWPALHPGAEGVAEGVTFDSARNPYIAQSERMRYDRACAKLLRMRLAAIELAAHEPVDIPLSPEELELARRPPTPARPSGPRPRDLSSPGREPPCLGTGCETPRRRDGVVLSDHFGLLVTLEPREVVRS